MNATPDIFKLFIVFLITIFSEILLWDPSLEYVLKGEVTIC